MSQKRNYKKFKNRMLKIKKILNKIERPDICLVSGLKQHTEINGEMYYYNSDYTPYYAFSYPEFNEEEQCFYRDVYDLEENVYNVTEFFFDINDVILYHSNWKK